MGATFSQFAGLEVPDGFGTDDFQYWLTQLVAGLDETVFLRAVSLTDRDAKFYSADAGVVCVVVDPAGPTVIGVYIKTSAPGSATWGTIWSPVIAIPWEGVTYVSNVQTHAGNPLQVYVDKNNQWATLAGAIEYIDGSRFLNNDIVASLPAHIVVDRAWNGDVSTSQAATTVPGTAYCAVGLTGTLTMSGMSTTSTGPLWIGFDGIRFPAHSTS